MWPIMWPQNRSLAGFKGYLKSISACDGAIRTLEKAWAEYTNL
jgi:hypothetical protein